MCIVTLKQNDKYLDQQEFQNILIQLKNSKLISSDNKITKKGVKIYRKITERLIETL